MIKQMIILLIILSYSCKNAEKIKELKATFPLREVQQIGMDTFELVNHQLGMFTPQLNVNSYFQKKDTSVLICTIAYPTYRDTISQKAFDIIILNKTEDKFFPIDTLYCKVKTFVLRYHTSNDQDKYIMLYNETLKSQTIFLIYGMKKYYHNRW